MDNVIIDKVELQSEIMPIRAYVECLVIKRDEDNIQAVDYLKKIKSAQKKVKDSFKPSIDAAHDAHKNILAFRDSFLDPLITCEDKIKAAMITFEREAEKERRRLQAIQEEEARRIEIEARKAQEQAEKLAEKGKEEKAEVKQQVADTLQVKADEIRQVVVEKQMTKNAGISYKDNWTANVKDISLVPREYLIPNMTALNGLAKATKGTVNIPGVEFVNNRTVSSRGF